MIAVFAYAFPHRKTHDFLVEIALAGYCDVTVFGAPFRKLSGMDRTSYFRRATRQSQPLDTKLICNRLGFEFVELDHTQFEDIAEIVKHKNITLGIVSGARILKRAVIESFSDGIVNFHPGRIPETSGLDAFFYTLKNNVDAGVTTHYIDPRVDAGTLLAFDAVNVQANDTPEDVQANAYALQLTALRQFLVAWKSKKLSPSPIDRPTKNIPMTVEEKWQTLRHFPNWRAARVMQQSTNSLHGYCTTGDVTSAADLLTRMPHLLESKSPEGWTPLIVAAFNQHTDLVETLLGLGANPNATGNKGTTVLMYAKTALMGVFNADYQLLDQLLNAGSRLEQLDMFGKSVLDYVESDPEIASFFKSREG